MCQRAVDASVAKHKEEASRETEAVALWIVKETQTGLDVSTRF